MRGAKRFRRWQEKFCNFNRLTRIRAECTLRDRRQVTLFLRRRRGSQGGSGEGIDVWRAPDLLLRQWMQVADQALQPLLDHVSIDLGGRDVGMAE